MKKFAPTLILVILVSAFSSSSFAARPKIIFFDVNETLLDLSSLKEPIAKALGGREDLQVGP